MTDLNKDDVRLFNGVPVEGERYAWSRSHVNPRPLEELYPYIKDTFDKGVKAITWHQYTPYFNDGEPCEFNVYDASVTTNPEVADAWLNEDFYIETRKEVSEQEYTEAKSQRYNYGYFEEDGKYWREFSEGVYDYEVPFYSGGHPDGIEPKSINLPITSSEFEDALRTAFGDHTAVVVTPERVVQFEYSHD